jgi:hypothetical protein
MPQLLLTIMTEAAAAAATATATAVAKKVCLPSQQLPILS